MHEIVEVGPFEVQVGVVPDGRYVTARQVVTVVDGAASFMLRMRRQTNLTAHQQAGVRALVAAGDAGLNTEQLASRSRESAGRNLHALQVAGLTLGRRLAGLGLAEERTIEGRAVYFVTDAGKREA